MTAKKKPASTAKPTKKKTSAVTPAEQPKRAKTKRAAAEPSGGGAEPSLATQVQTTLAWLERHGTQKTLDGMAGYGITASKAFGVTVADIRALAKQLGRNHELAAALWDTGWYEARMLTAFIDEPARVTPAQMDRWCRDFDNWGICDTLCFHLFDRTPHAFGKVTQWARRRDEFVKRAGFALLACLALHDRRTGNEPFVRCLPLLEGAAEDERNFVKKAVSWALRSIGGRNAELNAAALVVAQRLAASSDATARWVGKDSRAGLTSPATLERIAVRARARGA